MHDASLSPTRRVSGVGAETVVPFARHARDATAALIDDRLLVEGGLHGRMGRKHAFSGALPACV